MGWDKDPTPALGGPFYHSSTILWFPDISIIYHRSLQTFPEGEQELYSVGCFVL